jgi:hypothetical protein
MQAIVYLDTDSSRPLTPARKAWLLRMQFMFALLQEPTSVKFAVIKWRDGSEQILSRRRASAFRAGIAIESGPPNTEQIRGSEQGSISRVAEGALWMRDLRAGRNPLTRVLANGRAA